MAKKYNSVVHTIYAVQFSFDTLKEIYEFLSFKDVTYSVKDRTISGIITTENDVKLAVNKGDFVVKDSNGAISVWKNADFIKEFIEV